MTHDQAQAMALGDRVAVLRDGRIEQVAPPAEVYRRPANAFVASFLGEPAMALLPARLESDDDDRTWVLLGGQRLRLPGRPPGGLRGRAAGPVTVGGRPEHVTDASRTSGPVAVLFSTATAVDRPGAHAFVHCPLDPSAPTPPAVGRRGARAEIVARFPRSTAVGRGDRVELAVDVAELSFFDPVTGTALHNPD